MTNTCCNPRPSSSDLQPTAYGLPPFFGFTLIELLVVIVIIGVIVATVTISVNALGPDREAQEQAERIWAVLSQVKEESELTGRNVGVLLDRTGYEFVQFDSKTWSWKEISDDDLLAPRELPDGLFMRLSLEGREVVLKPRSERKPRDTADEKENAEKEPIKKTLQDAEFAPQIMLLASGDVNSFELNLAREGAEERRWKIYSKPDNSIELETASDDDNARQ